MQNQCMCAACVKYVEGCMKCAGCLHRAFSQAHHQKALPFEALESGLI